MHISKAIKYLALCVILPVIVYACIPNNNRESFGEFPDTPTNLTEFNTEYDDYNSTGPSFGETFPFCFSSNRKSNGDHYDIIYKLMSIEFSKDDRELRIFNNTSGNLSVVIENNNIANAMNKINTSSDEFGPYLIPRGLVSGSSNPNNRYESYILMYSSEHDGNQDILYTHNLDDESYLEPIKIDFLNSPFDDAYPSLNMDNSTVFFSSNRAGEYNIYSHEMDSSQDILDLLVSNNAESRLDTVLSSAFDDQCPFINEKILVFSSNREGGFGGYDLYYALWEDNEWSAPINFGEKINTEHDEFRPIVRQQWDFNNDIMIFSSNQPGGMGGFDLYYVGILELRE